jgi:hypothetical protein
MRRWLAIVVTAVAFSACAMHRPAMTVSDEAELLAEEQGRLTEETDPVERTKSYITVCDILLDFASSFAHDGNLDGMDALLSQYDTSVQKATNTMIQSDRHPGDSAGFQDLQVALKSQIRLLRRLRKNVPSKRREPVAISLGIATSAQESIRKLLLSTSGGRLAVHASYGRGVVAAPAREGGVRSNGSVDVLL